MKKFRRSVFGAAWLGALAFTFGGADTASARWFSHGSSGGSGGSWGSYGSSGGSGGSWGSYGSSGGSGGSWGSYGSSGGSGGSWGSYGSGGSWGSYGSGGGWGGYHVVSNVGVAGVAAERRVAYMNVNVPADATVYLQDQRMTLTGARRRFVTPEIKDGKELVYNLKVEIERDGRTVSKTTRAAVKAGQEVEVTVSFDEPEAGARVASVTPNRGR
jgi:uncharacterized protein (TIGR03000 family)